MGAEARPRLVLVVSDLFFEELVPPPGHATLELGCGEGRVCRDLAARGHAVIGIDAAPTPVAAAREADPGGRYLLADAAALPFGDGEFDLVVAYNSLMDVDDMPGAHPLEDYTRALEQAGFLVEAFREPPDPGAEDDRDRRIPQILWLRALKPGP